MERVALEGAFNLTLAKVHSIGETLVLSLSPVLRCAAGEDPCRRHIRAILLP
jgi:hypothetical protein